MGVRKKAEAHYRKLRGREDSAVEISTLTPPTEPPTFFIELYRLDQLLELGFGDSRVTEAVQILTDIARKLNGGNR